MQRDPAWVLQLAVRSAHSRVKGGRLPGGAALRRLARLANVAFDAVQLVLHGLCHLLKQLLAACQQVGAQPAQPVADLCNRAGGA